MSASNQASRRNRTRFPNTQNAQLPEDISDPHTNDDETKEALSTKIKRNWKFLIVAIPVALAFIVIFLRYFLELGVNIAANPWVQRGAAVAGIAGISFYAADQRRQSIIESHDRLVLDTPDGAKRFLGEVTSSTDDELHFRLHKGLTRFGSLGDPYTISEISHEMGESWAKAHHSPDAPATVRLHPALVSATKTGTGSIIVQETSGLKLEQFAREAALRADIPEYVQESVADDLREEIEQEAQEVRELKDVNAKLQRRLDAAKDAGAMPPEEFLESHKEFAKDMLQATRSSPNRSRSGDRSNGTGPTDIDTDAVAKDLADNDD